MMVKIQKNMVWTIIILVFLLAGSGTLTSLRALTSYPAYTTGYQGAKARFYGVRDQGKTYKEGLWDTTFKWDSPIDQGKYGNPPPIAGEMTSVFVPSESVGYQPSWIPSEWLLDATKTKNPVQTYEWEIKDGEETQFYRMELWKLKWYFSISCEPKDDGDIPYTPVNLLEKPRNSLQDTEVWFSFDLTPMWYFNGTENVYFALASLRLSDIDYGALEGGQTPIEHDSRLRVTPQSKSSILPIYYAGFGGARAEQDVFSFEGKELNPDLFTDRVYSYFTLNDFGVTRWWDWGGFWKADVVTVGLDVEVFVIGEWKVKDIQDIPDEYGRTAKTGAEGLGLGALFGAFFGSPEGRLWLLFLIGIGVFLVLSIFAPWVLLGIFQIFGSRRSRKGG